MIASNLLTKRHTNARFFLAAISKQHGQAEVVCQRGYGNSHYVFVVLLDMRAYRNILPHLLIGKFRDSPQITKGNPKGG